MIAWPTWLPAPKVDFANDVSQASIRTKMDSGRHRQRTRFTRQNRTIKVSWEMSDDQRAVFTSLFKYSLNGGNDWFEMELPLSEGVTTCTVRFIAQNYSEKYENVMYWTISATLEMQDQVAPLTAEEINALILLGGFEGLDDLEVAVARLYAVELEATIISA